jgi:hypothetical protein
MIVNEIVVRYHILDSLISNRFANPMAANTPFDSVIGTNFIPSEPDVQLINAYIVKPLSKITQLDLEISRLQAERDEIYARIQPYQALLSPIRRLPLDIMEKIFLFCLPTQRNPAMSTLEAPLKLGRICSSWRSFAYSCPRLWSRIHISLLHLGEIPEISTDTETDFEVYEIQEWRVEEAMAGIRCHLDGVSEWLTRAESHPLSISIFGRRYSSHKTATLPLLQTLLPFTKQWQDLELLATCDHSVILEFRQHFKLLEFPLLQSVYLRDVLFPFDPPNSPSPFEWLSTPSLRSLHALSLPSMSLVKSGIHWPNLTELTLLGPLITPSDAASILIGCANIVKCAFEVSEPRDGSVNLPESIELRQLKSLSFYEKVRFPVSLYLPKLCDLSFGTECLPDILRIDLLGTPSILHGLTTLTLDLFGFTPEPILECLSYASSLKRLTFRALKRGSERRPRHTDINMEIMAKVIEALTPTENDDLLVTAFCPNLETFECEMAPNFSDEVLETLIIKRTSSRFHGSTLWRVAVDFTQYPGRPMTLDLWASLENVVDDFFDLDLTYDIDEPDMSISAWSGVGTAEMVPEWALEGI